MPCSFSQMQCVCRSSLVINALPELGCLAIQYVSLQWILAESMRGETKGNWKEGAQHTKSLDDSGHIAPVLYRKSW